MQIETSVGGEAKTWEIPLYKTRFGLYQKCLPPLTQWASKNNILLFCLRRIIVDDTMVFWLLSKTLFTFTEITSLHDWLLEVVQLLHRTKRKGRNTMITNLCISPCKATFVFFRTKSFLIVGPWRALVAGNGSYILRPCGHDLHSPTLIKFNHFQKKYNFPAWSCLRRIEKTKRLAATPVSLLALYLHFDCCH